MAGGADISLGGVNLKALLREGRDGKRTAVALLTYPMLDVDGDYLDPAGIRCERDSGLTVNWEHKVPVGAGSVGIKSVPVNGTPTRVPVGTTKFFETATDLKGIDRGVYPIENDKKPRTPAGTYSISECLRAAEDVAEMVATDFAPGVSVEYLALKALPLAGTSPISGRPSLNIREWQLTSWAHCRYPRNAQALTVDQDVFVKALLETAHTGRLPGGYSLKSQTVRDSFAPLRDAAPRRATVTSGYTGVKAMDDLDAGMNAAPVDDTLPPDGAGDDLGMEDAGPPLTSQRCYDFAQGVLDLCEQAVAGMDEDVSPEHTLKPAVKRVRDKLMALVESVKSFADDANALGEKADKAAGSGDKDEGDDAEPDADGADADEMPEPVTTKSTGELVVKSGYTPRRFKMSELEGATAAAPAPAPESPSPAALKSLAHELERLKRDLKAKRRLAALNAR